MMTEEVHKKMFYWNKNPLWYRLVENSYMYELTDKAPEKARESYAKYKAEIDKTLDELGATPYEGVIIDL